MKTDKNIIKFLRHKHGYTQEQLAHYCGCNERTIARVEKDGICSAETLNALAAVFGVQTWYLIGKKSIEQFQRNENGEEQYLTRLYTRKMIVESFIESIAYKIDYEIPKNSVDAELVSGAIQEIKDWGEIWSDLDIGEQIKAMSPQTNGICERFHKTILNEFYQVTFRKKLYSELDELQKDLDEWMHYYNNARTHQGKMCCGRTPQDTLIDGKLIWAEKNLAQI